MFKRSIYFFVIIIFFSEYVKAQSPIWEAASTSSSFKRFRVLQIFPSSGDTVFAITGTDQTHLFYTSNYGNTWNPASNVANISGFAIGSTGRYYTSSPDGIDTSFDPLCDICVWTTLPQYGLKIPLTALLVRGATDAPGVDELWVGTDSGLFFRKFTDSVWVQKDSSAVGSPILQIAAAGKNIYYRTSTKVYISNDGGITWNDRTPVNFGTITSILVTSDKDAFVSVTGPLSSSVYHSSSAGSDAFSDPFPPAITGIGGRTINTLVSNAAGDLFLGGGIANPIPTLSSQGYVLKYPHNGTQWGDFSDGLPADSGRSSEVICLGFSANQTAFAGTDSQGVFHTALKSAVKPELSLDGIALGQNYPNPANGLTEFSVDVDRALLANIAVFDIVGRKMFELSSDFLSPGEHIFTIDTKALPAGTYFYRLTTQEGMLSKMFVVSR